MSDIVGITGGMGGDLSGPSLGVAPATEQMVALEVGVMVDRVAFHVHSSQEGVKLPVIVSFSIAEAYQLIAAIETGIAHIRKL